MDWWQIVLLILTSIAVGFLAGGLLGLIVRFLKKRLVTKSETTAVVEEQLKPIVLDLLTEVENNRRVATKPWSGELLPFQTELCLTSQDEVHKLPVNLRDGLTQAYADIRLANGVVWLSTELGRRSQNLDEHYLKLCGNIAAALDKVAPLLEQLGNHQYEAYHDGERHPVSQVQQEPNYSHSNK